jgi:O-antigen/teichoic acid export membrane protein
MVNARTFLKNLTWLSAGDITAKILAFFAFAHLARVLGSDGFGAIGFAAAFTLYFSLIVTQGLDVYAIQEVARDIALLQRRAAAILGLRVVSALVAYPVLVVVSFQIGKPAAVRTLVLLYGLSFIPSSLSLQWVFQAAERMKFVAGASVLGQMVFASTVLLLIAKPSQIYLVPILQCTGEVAAVLYYVCLYRKHFGRLEFAFHPGEWSYMLKQSLPMGLSAALSLVMINFDTVLLGFMKPASEVGEYSAAYKVIFFFSSLVLLYNRNLFPAVSRTRGQPEELRRISEKTQKYCLLLAIPLALGGSLLSRPLMAIVFGPEFTRGAAPLAILIWIIPMSSLRVLYRVTLQSHGLQKLNLYLAVVAVVVNVGLNLLLIPRFSIVGSAAASLAAEIVLLAISHRAVASRVAPLPFAEHLVKPLITAIPMVVFLLVFSQLHVVFCVALGFLIYVTSGVVFRTFDLREISAAAGIPGLVKPDPDSRA